MSQIIHATFEDGVLKPDVRLPFPSMTRVRVIVEPLTAEGSEPEKDAVMSELERIWEEIDVDSGGPPPSRDELHDRTGSSS
jgi:predicted DNA-binding antitoxin AbrB/MazE fold protein